MEQGPMRIDLHVHSKFTACPSLWILQKLGCPESFTEPHEIYHIAKTRGMTLVTITGHNRIEGALEIAHLPDAFISEEITTYFPEDRCKIHILALNIRDVIFPPDRRQFLQAVPGSRHRNHNVRTCTRTGSPVIPTIP